MTKWESFENRIFLSESALKKGIFVIQTNL